MALQESKFRTWWWPNRSNIYNLTYPFLYYLFAKGDIRVADGDPLYFKRIKKEPHYKDRSARNPVFNYFCFILRKMNLLLFSLYEVLRSSRSLLLTIALLPVFTARFTIDLLYSIKPVFKRRLKSNATLVHQK